MKIDSRRVGVVGAGNMGAGIAQKYATEGFTVIVVDVDAASVERGRARVQQTLDEGVARKIFAPAVRDEILARMTFSPDKDALKGCALVVEAVFEDLGVKEALFKDLDQRLGKETILATNTSSFYVDDVARVCQHPDRVVGLHYFYHPAKNRLVEVIAGKQTSKQAFAAAWKIQEACGKTPVDSKDAPGFIVNRFFVPWLNEAMRLVADGTADIATVEAAARSSFGVGMGPFELMNVTGVPITLHAATTLGKELGAFYAPCDLIRPVVEAKKNWDLAGTPDRKPPSRKDFDVVNERLWGVVWQVAVQLVFDEKVCSLEDCDLGARTGLRWPKGPFEVMNERGSRQALLAVQAIAARYPDVKVPAILLEHGSKNAPFAIELVSKKVDGDVGVITFQRPDAMNALNEAVVEQLGQAFDALHADPKVKGIVIQGKGKAFVAGADTKFFVEQIERGDIERIVRFASDGQDVFARIDRSSKPVVCKLHGLSLGGGSELALACDWIVASSSGSLGFPETGIGIYPGLGGTQRSARKIGVPLARWLVLTGESIDAKTGLQMGLVDDVVDAELLDEACRKRALSGKTRAEAAPPTTPPAGFEDLWRVFTFTSIYDLLKGLANVEGKRAKSVGKVAFKAPLAAQAADELVKMASSSSLAEGLAAETAGLKRVFSSKDALEGLSTIGVRRPSFKGA
ncbi:MAG: 3-hydroxyacyl-CoA dehydrogenase/enoyl-CoA hydratase family protein [Deltaproteobacteria bacterium]|nr:3-hydroxyacyl-CoA dehydrogenase/enoyl-CoA hydratase family protein [Deltaproteobacteria bacterium]